MSQVMGQDTIKQKLICELEKDSEITSAILFDSFATGTAKNSSDIDIAIKLKKPMLEDKKIQLIQILAQQFGRAIDLVDLNKVGVSLC